MRSADLATHAAVKKMFVTLGVQKQNVCYIFTFHFHNYTLQQPKSTLLLQKAVDPSPFRGNKHLSSLSPLRSVVTITGQWRDVNIHIYTSIYIHIIYIPHICMHVYTHIFDAFYLFVASQLIMRASMDIYCCRAYNKYDLPSCTAHRNDRWRSISAVVYAPLIGMRGHNTRVHCQVALIETCK